MTRSPYIEFGGDHQYWVDGIEYPSVSSILDHAGAISSFCKNNSEATHRGTEVHRLRHEDDLKRLDLRQVPERYRGYIRAYRKWRADTGFIPEASEEIVYSPHHRYAGRFDVIGSIPNQAVSETIVDIKTGVVSRAVAFQLIAYCLAYDANKFFSRIAVQLRPDGRYNSVPYSVMNFTSDRAQWLGMVNSYHQFKQGQNKGQNNG